MQSLPTCLATLILAFAPLLGAQTPQQRVLLIYGHNPEAPGTRLFVNELQRVTRDRAGVHVEFYSEMLDYDRFPTQERWPEMADDIAEKYRAAPPHAILTEGTAALLFARDHLTQHFPHVPVIFAIPFEPVGDFRNLPAHFTGRLQPLPFAETFSLARRLQPDARRVLVVGGASAMDSAIFNATVQQLRPLLGDVELVPLRGWTYPTLLAELREAPPGAFVLLSAFRKDHDQYAFNPGDIITSISRVSPVPVYGFVSNWVGDGIVGGAVMDFADEGANAGRLLLRVLGRPPGQPLPPIEVARSELRIDWRQLQRWGLSEKRLPPGTRVLFLRSTVWERYRFWIIAAVLIMAAQLSVIGLLLLERKRRRRTQRIVVEQAAFERMIANVTLGAVRFTLDRSSGMLEYTLSHIGRYAGALTVGLECGQSMAADAPEQLTWSRAGAESTDPGDGMVIPLIEGGVPVGQLTLHFGDQPAPSSRVMGRVECAADILAGALGRARTAQALEQTQWQVTHMARVAAVGQITAAVSHELRQPLTAIRALAETGVFLLSRPEPDLAEARDIFQDIVSADQRASNVIDHIRALLRNERPAHATVNINSLCIEVVQLLDGEAKSRHVRLETALDPHTPLTRGDAVQLQQVLINLVLNAVDAAANASGDRQVVVGTREGIGEVELLVRDNGLGLTPEIKAQVFEPFFSTKSRSLGMGLAIVRMIVERHQGAVEVADAPDGGALFRVLLPKADGPDEFTSALPAAVISST